MDFLLDQLKFLGLNAREIRVFTALATFGRMNMTKISSRAGLSRTTVDAIVRRLVTQGLLTQERAAGHQEHAVRLHDVADRLEWLEQRLRPVAAEKQFESRAETPNTATDGDPEHSGTAAPGAACTVFGHGHIHDMVAEAFSRHEEERVVMLMSAMAPTEDRMTRFEHCIGYARRARVKLELLTTTDVAKGLSPHAKEILSLLVSYDLRLNFLPPSFCFDYIDVLAFRDVVLLINQHTEHAEQVVGTDEVLVYNHLLRVVREAGWGMDIRMWLQGVMESTSHNAIQH